MGVKYKRLEKYCNCKTVEGGCVLAKVEVFLVSMFLLISTAYDDRVSDVTKCDVAVLCKVWAKRSQGFTNVMHHRYFSNFLFCSQYVYCCLRGDRMACKY